MNQTYNLKRVHKVNLFAVLTIVVFFIVKSIIIKGPESLGTILTQTLPIAAIVVVLYFLPIKALVKGFLLGLLPTISVLAVLYLDGYGLDRHYLIFVSIAMVALYFESKLLIIHGLVLNIAFIALYIVRPMSIINSAADINLFISVLFVLNGIYLFLFFLTRWGKSIIKMASDEKSANEIALNTLASTMKEIESNTSILNSNMHGMTQNANLTKDSSHQVALAMQEIAIGVQEQAESVTDINMQVAAISEDVNEAHNISNQLTDSNSEMMAQVTTGEEEIQIMNTQMSIIDTSIEAAIVTVKDLEVSMADIKNFLSVITAISAQTNLLALNASIESARAGEAGKGFAVVADEIRKLAEQSANSVNDINNIVASINVKTNEAVETVSRGNSAVDEGSNIIKNITTQYASIKNAFIDNNKSLDREIIMINQINEAFNIVHEKISNIASISQQQSASTQEILATIENQDANIENLTNSLLDIDELGQNLTNLIEKIKDRSKK